MKRNFHLKIILSENGVVNLKIDTVHEVNIIVSCIDDDGELCAKKFCITQIVDASEIIELYERLKNNDGALCKEEYL